MEVQNREGTLEGAKTEQKQQPQGKCSDLKILKDEAKILNGQRRGYHTQGHLKETKGTYGALTNVYILNLNAVTTMCC